MMVIAPHTYPYLTVGTLLPFKLRPLCEENHVALCSYEEQNNVIKSPCFLMKKAYHIMVTLLQLRGSTYEGFLCLPPYFVGCALQHDSSVPLTILEGLLELNTISMN